jgi:hypothetical protein
LFCVVQKQKQNNSDDNENNHNTNNNNNKATTATTTNIHSDETTQALSFATLFCYSSLSASVTLSACCVPSKQKKKQQTRDVLLFGVDFARRFWGCGFDV